MDPTQLIQPVFDVLDTLGTGEFSGVDPTNVLNEISNAVETTSGPLQQALGPVGQSWLGEHSATAGAQTSTALANGTQLATQANGLSDTLSAAASNVAQTRTQLIDIIDGFLTTVAACDLSTPDGKAVALTAADQAITEATGVMQQSQDNQTSLTGKVLGIGAPVGATQANAAGASMFDSTVNSLIGPNSALYAVTTDPRLTPQSEAENWMDLLFLPTTVTQLNQGISQTNTIMTGLGNTLNTTNATIGQTNIALGTATTAINSTTAALGTTNQNLSSVNRTMGGVEHALGNTNAELGGVNTTMGGVKGALDTTNGELAPNSALNNNLATTNSNLGTVNGTMGGLGNQLNTTNQAIGGLDGDMNTLNNNIPGSTKIIPGTPEPAPGH